jgi:hypothetical protein
LLLAQAREENFKKVILALLDTGLMREILMHDSIEQRSTGFVRMLGSKSSGRVIFVLVGLV